MKKKLWVILALVGFVFASITIGQEEEQGKPAPEKSQLKAEIAVICKNVDREKRQPVEPGDKFPADVGRLYCFTKIAGAEKETEIKHLWYHGDNLLATVTLPVKSSSWRTWSSKAIEKTRKGKWKVEIKDAEDKLITTLYFIIE